eukprot:TRINITY_DN46064_c0_g1_i1.p1 TRINITY_DN46064_c0_g1~~TRINITY_DN46064_c0_g1_i1.p1  ORF type:complete len:167 (-),score=16.71 TRINITY_DN46064_c0_g1_i1:58-558(-)
MGSLLERMKSDIEEKLRAHPFSKSSSNFGSNKSPLIPEMVPCEDLFKQPCPFLKDTETKVELNPTLVEIEQKLELISKMETCIRNNQTAQALKFYAIYAQKYITRTFEDQHSPQSRFGRKSYPSKMFAPLYSTRATPKLFETRSPSKKGPLFGQTSKASEGRPKFF